VIRFLAAEVVARFHFFLSLSLSLYPYSPRDVCEFRESLLPPSSQLGLKFFESSPPFHRQTGLILPCPIVGQCSFFPFCHVLVVFGFGCAALSAAYFCFQLPFLGISSDLIYGNTPRSCRPFPGLSNYHQGGFLVLIQLWVPLFCSDFGHGIRRSLSGKWVYRIKLRSHARSARDESALFSRMCVSKLKHTLSLQERRQWGCSSSMSVTCEVAS